jgi:hypothetical protein
METSPGPAALLTALQHLQSGSNSDQNSSNNSSVTKRVRRTGKYTQQEREKIRRERNRVHAKKTRDRKKQLLEVSEKLVTEMEEEAHLLRDYLFSMQLLTEEDVSKCNLRDQQSQQEIAALKVNIVLKIEFNYKSKSFLSFR